jgi:pyruvate/2-oxoglutarate dehydrogenase complex dihydrolipoamide acyltransferase (E2) component
LSSSATETGVDVLMPQMGTSVFEGTVVAWLKQVGDEIAAEETICEVSTDKIDTECPSPAAGTLTEILVKEGETVEVGTVLARIGGAGGSATTTSDAEPPATAVPAEQAPAVAPAPPPRPATNGEGRRYSPLVKRIAAEHGIDLSGLSGSGRGGRVTKKDVLAAVESGPAKQPLLHSDSPYRPDPPAEQAQAPARNALAEGLGGVAEPLSRIRQSIGAAMLDSQRTAATCHTIVECDMTRVEARRRELGLTALPLVARATIETLREFPQLNATLDGTTITRFERVHLGIAVSLGEAGLMVPVVHDAHELSAEGLGTRIKDLARRARAKELGADDVRGASFTITNPGQFGALLATPVINQPQVGILDLEAVVKRPVVVSGPDGEDLIAIRPMVNLILGWDHRAMDGVYAASFLSALRAKLEAL